jgi:hypothetical protein
MGKTMSWRLAKCLETLRSEVNAAHPERSKLSDGTISDESHKTQSSETKECPCHGVVCAIDLTNDPKGGFDSHAFAEWLRERVRADETRVMYVISHAKIFSGQGQGHPAGKWRPYKGSNPHKRHVHISVRHGADFYDDETPWHWPPDAAA